ncbi:calcium-activated chloride channel-domain-containing protein [Chytriomyces sp. MP71]|nr:calcium-activated chloride channel-domain-containing protein [Chytriomyces sp. MP71]
MAACAGGGCHARTGLPRGELRRDLPRSEWNGRGAHGPPPTTVKQAQQRQHARTLSLRVDASRRTVATVAHIALENGAAVVGVAPNALSLSLSHVALDALRNNFGGRLSTADLLRVVAAYYGRSLPRGGLGLLNPTSPHADEFIASHSDHEVSARIAKFDSTWVIQEEDIHHVFYYGGHEPALYFTFLRFNLFALSTLAIAAGISHVYNLHSFLFPWVLCLWASVCLVIWRQHVEPNALRSWGPSISLGDDECPNFVPNRVVMVKGSKVTDSENSKECVVAEIWYPPAWKHLSTTLFIHTTLSIALAACILSISWAVCSATSSLQSLYAGPYYQTVTSIPLSLFILMCPLVSHFFNVHIAIPATRLENHASRASHSRSVSIKTFFCLFLWVCAPILLFLAGYIRKSSALPSENDGDILRLHNFITCLVWTVSLLREITRLAIPYIGTYFTVLPQPRQLGSRPGTLAPAPSLPTLEQATLRRAYTRAADMPVQDYARGYAETAVHLLLACAVSAWDPLWVPPLAVSAWFRLRTEYRSFYERYR